MARDNGIISLGNEWYLYPPQFWGSRDRARAAAVEPRETGNLPVVAPLPEIAPGCRSKPRRARVDARSAAVDRILGDLGIR
jgi:hypothetical protein